MSRAIAALRASPRHSAKPEPVPVSAAVAASVDYRGENRELRDRLLAAELRCIRLEGMAKRAAWALQGVCKALEREGIDTTYWRDLANDIERRASQ